jgi:CRP-like cAMP-binding protein
MKQPIHQRLNAGSSFPFFLPCDVETRTAAAARRGRADLTAATRVRRSGVTGRRRPLGGSGLALFALPSKARAWWPRGREGCRVRDRPLAVLGADGWERLRALALEGKSHAMPPLPASRNAVLRRLSSGDFALLEPHLAPVDLPLRRRLADAHRPIDAVYFLDSGIASTVAAVRHEVPVEIGMVGREGVVNLAVLLGSDRAPSDSYMQMAGAGLQASAAAVAAAMERSRSLTRWLLRCTHIFMVQTASTVLANGRATVQERLARWLLMAHDRAESDALPLTHEFLAIMLGVRRSGVTVAVRALERRGSIEAGRGLITVLDRRMLEEQANGYYGMAETEMHRLFEAPDAE